MNIACTKETMLEGLHRLKVGITQYLDWNFTKKA